MNLEIWPCLKIRTMRERDFNHEFLPIKISCEYAEIMKVWGKLVKDFRCSNFVVPAPYDPWFIIAHH